MAKYIIEGGFPLKGKVTVSGAKNAGFKLMIASLLSDETSALSNISYIRDVISVKKIIEALGAKVDFSDDTMQVNGGIKSWEVPSELGIGSRASFMYLPVLLHRFKKGRFNLPVGDKIGERPINWFLDGLEKMGATIVKTNGLVEANAPKGLSGCNYTFPKNSHTGTEGLIMAAVLAKGKTRLENAAAEPEIDDLIAFLNKMGAKISRVSERIIEIDGVNSLKGTTYKVMPDRNEVVTFCCIALGTKGDIEIENANQKVIEAFIQKVKKAGGGVEMIEKGLRAFYKGELKPVNIETAPYPGFMTDWQPLWTTLMTQAVGESIVHETIFENRFAYVPSLQKMGAEIKLFSPPISNPDIFYNFDWNSESAKYPHAVKISGPRKLKGSELEVTDIRAGATLVLAALIADRGSVLEGIEHIERGYVDLEGRLASLGAKIKRID